MQSSCLNILGLPVEYNVLNVDKITISEYHKTSELEHVV